VNSVEKPSSLILQSTMVSESAKTKLSGTSLRCVIPQLQTTNRPQYCEEWNDAKRGDFERNIVLFTTTIDKHVTQRLNVANISPVVDHLCAEPSGLNL
jgi:hypothetical protein